MTPQAWRTALHAASFIVVVSGCTSRVVTTTVEDITEWSDSESEEPASESVDQKPLKARAPDPQSGGAGDPNAQLGRTTLGPDDDDDRPRRPPE